MKNLLRIKHSSLSAARLLFYCLLLSLFPFLTHAQKSKGACGVYHKPVNKSSLGHAIDLVDQFGNGYTFDELNVEHFRDRHAGGSRNVSNCTGGDFVLEFSGLTCDEEITICNVFQEISALIDIGPNGSNPVITVVKEPFLNPDGSNDASTLGTGTTYFQLDCGIANNLIFDIMYSDIIDALPNGLAAGALRINDLLPFYNDVQGPVAGNYDLHTVALHEVLHILGFSSRMQDGGVGVDDAYSRWDTHLFSNDDERDLIVPGDATPGCCDLAVFNPQLDYNDVIIDNCNMNVFFRDNGQNIAEAFGTDYPTSNPGGLLSHLDRCGEPGDQFVMSASLSQLEEKDITQEEIDILEALGYEMEGQDVACSVIANNDFFFINNLFPSSSSNISIFEILANDNLPDDFDHTTDLTFHVEGSGCGTVDDFSQTLFLLDVDFHPNFIQLRLPMCGSVDICYTITGCDGACDDGVITVQRICEPCYPNLPDCTADLCAGDNLFCYGDFQDFIPKTPGQFDPTFELDSPFCPFLHGSPDIYYNPENENRVLGFSQNTESIIIPLSSPVPPGCSINLSYRFIAVFDGTLNFFGTSISPCLSNQAAICPSDLQSDFQCISSLDVFDGLPIGASIAGDLIPCDDTTPPDIDCNCTSEFRTVPTHDAGYILMDDLVITADCENEISVMTDNPVPVCRGDEAVVGVLVCIEGGNTTPNDVVVTADFPDIPGLEITLGSEFDGGSALINNAVAGSSGNPNCYPLHFNLNVGYTIAVGSQLEVNFEVETANACVASNSHLHSLIDVIDCGIPCILQDHPTITSSCDNDGAIDVIIAGGSGDYSYEWDGNFGNTPSISGLAPGTYGLLVTDNADPNCYIKVEFIVPVGDDCNLSCVGEGVIEVEHRVVQIVCLESEPGFFRYYIDMFIPNWGGTQNNDFELCTEDLFVTTPGVELESSELFLFQTFPAVNIFAIIRVPIGFQIDQGICFETPVCVNAEQYCASFCVTDFPVCSASICDLEVVPSVGLSTTTSPCGNLVGDDLYTANIALQIQNANGYTIDYVQYQQINGNADPVFWQENNVPVNGGVAIVPDQALCWKAYDNEYFCFTVRIGYSDGTNQYFCEENICLLVGELLLDGGNDGHGERRDVVLQKENQDNVDFSVFPNPVNHDLTVQNPHAESVEIRLMTMHGKLLSGQFLAGYGQSKVSVGDYPPGVYLLQIKNGSSDAILHMQKVIVAH